MEMVGKRVLVVGASGVLGSLIAQELIEQGAEVLGTASSNESALRIPEACSLKLLLDLTSDQSISTLAEYINATGIDGIVLASGLVAFGNTSEMTPEVLEKLFQVNAIGQMKLLMKVQSALERADGAFMLAIPGVVAEAPLPGLAAYSASKTALQGFLVAITREWRRQGINVISARPGHTETGLATRAIAGSPPAFPSGLEPRSVAKRMVSAILAGEKDLASEAFS